MNRRKKYFILYYRYSNLHFVSFALIESRRRRITDTVRMMMKSTMSTNLGLFVLILTCWGCLIILFDAAPTVLAQNGQTNNDNEKLGWVTNKDNNSFNVNDNDDDNNDNDSNDNSNNNDAAAPVPAPVVPFTAAAPTTAVTDPPTPAGTTAAAECPLKCNNNGVCKQGNSDYTEHPKEIGETPFTFLQATNREGWYCDCPDGYTGLRCNRKYEKCPIIATETNNVHTCYHGGQCIDGLTDGSHDNIDIDKRFCDCSSAQHNDVPYFGKYCEIEGAVRCDPTSQVFCTAQGTCKDGYEKKAHPCDCLEGHRGAHCEFIRNSVPACILPCGGVTGREDGTIDQPTIGGVGQCTLGVKDFETARYQDFWLSHDENYQYCKCPEDWFGDNCDVPGEVCGGAHCFNGGECLQTLNSNDETTFACDCRVAGHNGFSYAGQYCENVESDNCNKDDDNDGHQQHANGQMFCTNGGTCKDPNNPHLGCDCPGAHFGPICEYHKKEDGECSLTCQNEGQCRTGLKDNSLIEKLGKEMSAYNATQHSELFEHCVCASGFFGIQCEHKLEICPGGDHVCLHGSQCVAQNEGGSNGDDEVHHTCDCDHAFDAVERYAGKFCQYTSTDICTINGQPGMGKANFAFCVNNGICKGKVNDGEDSPGCTCPQGYSGDHCEYLLSDDDVDFWNGKNSDVPKVDKDPSSITESGVSSDSSEGPYQKNGLVIGLSSVVIVIVVLIALIILRALFCGGSTGGKTIADVQGALDEEDGVSGSVTTTSQSNKNDNNSLEDVEDYVNNQSGILTENEMENVQIV